MYSELDFILSLYQNISLYSVFVLQVEDLLSIDEQIDIDVRSLETCAYSTSIFADILNKIQKAVDDLSLHQYSNLHLWVSKLDEEVGNCFLHLIQFGNYQ